MNTVEVKDHHRWRKVTDGKPTGDVIRSRLGLYMRRPATFDERKRAMIGLGIVVAIILLVLLEN